MLLNLSLSSISYSQKILRNEFGDTSICFTIDQSRIILKQINKLNYLDSLQKLNEYEIITLKSNMQLLEMTINEKNVQLEIKDEIISSKEEKIQTDKLDYKYLKNQLVKEKIKKWIAITTGTITTGFMTYLWITK